MSRIQLRPLVPVENDVQLAQALTVMDELLDIERKRPRTAEEDAYLDVLTDIIHAYDERTWKEKPVEDRHMLDHLLESRQVSQSQLARGARIAESTISEVLHGKRKLTRAQISKIANWFKISPDLFSAGV